MSDITKVYIVTAGEYSEYHICAVFATREEAEAYIKAHEHEYYAGSYTVNEYDIGHFGGPDMLYEYTVHVFSRFSSRPTSATLRYPSCEKGRDSIACEVCDSRGNSRVCNILDCYAHPGRTVVLREKDEEKAIKIVLDRIAKAKAEREGL